MDANNHPSQIVRAARYGRKSTGDQENSIALQFETIDAYAAIRGMQIVRSYVDDGISGLTIKGRDALQDLIELVQSGQADFTVILVYDVSRWGRFQDVDESAYYEFICRSFGVAVHYCAELFANDGSFFAAIAKGLKRAMAAEYSRDLSVKVFAAHARMVKLGYSQGGSPGYGLRRLLIDRTGAPKFQLAPGEHKAITTDRVVIIPGPREEVETVRWIFETFVRRRLTERQIATALNRRGVSAVNGRAWTRQAVWRILLNERYIGNYVWNQESIKLKSERVDNSPEKWIRAEGVIQPIIERELFQSARDIIRERLRDLSEEDKLKPLKVLLLKHGTLSRRIIDEAPGVPSSASYHRWFGGLIPTYNLVGFRGYRKFSRRAGPMRSRHATTLHLTDNDLLDLLRDSLKKHGYLSRRIIDETEGIPSAGTYFLRFGSMKRVYRLVGFPQDFHRVPAARSGRHAITQNMSDSRLLEGLRQRLQRHGYLTGELIDECEEIPSAATYRYRFGSLRQAYQRIGFTPGRHTSLGVWKPAKRRSKKALLRSLKELANKHGRLSQSLIDAAPGIPGHRTFQRCFGSLRKAYRLIGLKRGAHKQKSTNCQ